MPETWILWINAFNKPSIKTIRVNTLKISPEELKEQLEKKDFKLRPTKWFDNAFHIDSTDSKLKLGATHEYLKGFYYIQSLASMVPAHLLYPQPGDRVIDMCASPGSKTTQIGQMMKQQGIIIAIDAKITRIKSLTSNIKRCGIKNAIVFPHDSTQLKMEQIGPYKPNKILLDAPCSGSGIIREDPTIKRVKNDNDIKRLAQIQKKLLSKGLEFLQPEGYLMYSTCSFHYQENEQVIAETLQKFDNIEIVEPFEDIGLPGFDHVGEMDFGYDLIKSRRLFPNIHDTDAFFFCLMKKNK